jgi:type III secretory pathway component EscS
MSGAGGRPRSAAPAWDPPLTVALLVAGVINVTVTVANMRELPETLQLGYEQQGIGHYTATTLASAMGWSVILSSTLALVIAIAFAVPRLRAHRLAFWVPLVAAVVSLVLTTVFVGIAVFGDPAGAAYFQRNSGL